MPSTVSSKGESDFTPIPAGTYIGRCYQVINLGLQAAGPYEPKGKHYLGFEIPAERFEYKDANGIEQEGPAVVGARYTSSLSPKATLRLQLETWRGRVFTDEELAEFDLFKLIGAPAMISIVHSDDGRYANISAIVRLPKGMICGPAELPTAAYDPMDPMAAVEFEKLSPRMKETVIKGQALAAAQAAPVPAAAPAPGHQTPSALLAPSAPDEYFDDDIPF